MNLRDRRNERTGPSSFTLVRTILYTSRRSVADPGGFTLLKLVKKNGRHAGPQVSRVESPYPLNEISESASGGTYNAMTFRTIKSSKTSNLSQPYSITIKLAPCSLFLWKDFHHNYAMARNWATKNIRNSLIFQIGSICVLSKFDLPNKLSKLNRFTFSGNCKWRTITIQGKFGIYILFVSLIVCMAKCISMGISAAAHRWELFVILNF